MTEQIRRSHIAIDDARIDLASLPLLSVTQRAYRVPGDQIVGPSWIAEERFDIQATLPAGSSKNDAPEMLQTLLSDRFKLAIHHDQKTSSVYALTVTKDGPKFHESAPDDPATPGCEGGLNKTCHKTTMDDLVNSLMLPFRARMGAGWAVDRPIIDETGLTGSYDFGFAYGRSGPVGGPEADSDSYTA